jgi:hemerythrin
MSAGFLCKVHFLSKLEFFLFCAMIKYMENTSAVPRNLITGISEIDDQHQGLLDLINSALGRCGGDDVEARECFTEMRIQGIGSLEKHFATEESLMRERGYPKFAEHKGKHDRMLRDLKEIAEEIEAGRRPLELLKLVVYVREWFTNHIREADTPMAEYCRRGP